MKNPRNKRKLDRLVILLVIIGGGYLYNNYINQIPGYIHENSSSIAPSNHQYSDVIQAITNHQSDVQVEGSGLVSKILPDDNQGSRHQRFLVKLSTDQVILIAHNIDLAPRIESLNAGEKISFYGVFEWNDKGGLVHWTHHDPQQRHLSGWLKYQGRTYQ